jgi:hypothetical protein
MKLFAFAKKAGLSFHQTFRRDVSTSTNAMHLMDHQECAVSMPNVRTEMAAMSARAHRDFLEILKNNAST